MFNKNSKKAKAEKLLRCKYLDQLKSIAREVGLKPTGNKDDLVQHILNEGDLKKLYKVLDLNERRLYKFLKKACIPFFIGLFYFLLSDSPYNPYRHDPVSECKFESNADTLQVLILPFNNRTDQSNAGDIISKRLSKVVDQENLSANIEYCEQFEKIGGLTKQRVTELAEELNADLIIYGDMEKEYCDDKKICLNWISRDKYDYETYNEYTSTDNSSYQVYDNSELRNGSLQENNLFICLSYKKVSIIP